MFGTNTLQILDSDPERLLEVPGISSAKLKKISDSYLASRGARDVVAFLAPHGITPNRAVKLYRQYGDDTMNIVRNHPYQLCEMAGIGFRTADKIAMSMGFDKLSPERVDEGLLFTLTESETRGNLCMEKHDFIRQSLKLLETAELSEQMAAARAARLLHDRKIVTYHGWVYRPRAEETERRLAERIFSLQTNYRYRDAEVLESEIEGIEVKLRLSLNEDQRTAVATAVREPLTIITGGPGTGKTLTERALLALYRTRHPTGRVAVSYTHLTLPTIA